MFAASKTSTATSGYQISRSLRFNSADSSYLNRTPATATNRTTWTYSLWLKISSLVNEAHIFDAGTDQFAFYQPNGELVFYGNATTILSTTQLFRDFSAWYHVVLVWDTSQATASNRVKLYVNGSQVTAFTATSYPAQNATLSFNNNVQHRIGEYAGGGPFYYNGYMTEINFIDGQALTPSSFGEISATTGVWQPKAFAGTYGTNGFYLNFSDNSNTTAATLGKDYSGNGNNWTPNNFSVTAGAGNDSLVDSPTSFGTDTGVGGTVRGNYCTLNPLTTTTGTYTQGNLRYVGANQDKRPTGTISVSTGQWYWEVTLANAPYSPRATNSAYNAFGFVLSTVFNSTTSPPVSTDALVLADSGYYKNFSGAFTDGGVAFLSGDVLSVAVDLDANTFTFRRNNTSLATGTIGGTAGRELVPFIFSYNGDYGVMDCNFGQRPFAYTAPSGFKALCTQNLPTPTIGATSATLAGKYFNPVLYTGTGSSLSVTGVGFQPDWVWIKGRSGATDHGLYDAVRGVQKQLESNTTTAETTETTGITAFGSDGFTTGALAQLNTSAATYVAWNWIANGAGSSNTSGSITSTVSANTTSGFSIVKWAVPSSPSGSNTIGHGLGVAPTLIISKSLSSSGWPVYTSTTGAGNVLFLHNTNASASNDAYSSTPSSSVFTVSYSSGSWTASTNQISYCFTPIAGYSAFGSYTGNGSADGPFVYTGFRPAFLLAKDSTNASTNWYMWDSLRGTYNANTALLFPNLSNAEDSLAIDLLSNGFKPRVAGSGLNTTNAVMIYMAFASNPFKYSLAR